MIDVRVRDCYYKILQLTGINHVLMRQCACFLLIVDINPFSSSTAKAAAVHFDS
jgi:hypothetical protein